MTYVTESGDALTELIATHTPDLVALAADGISEGEHLYCVECGVLPHTVQNGAQHVTDALIASGAVVTAADVWEEGYRHGRGKVDPAQVDVLNPYVQKVGHTDE